MNAGCRGLGPRSSASGQQARLEQIGRIERIGDGIATVSGLPDARLDEVLRFGDATLGYAVDLRADEMGCVLLGRGDQLSAGDRVRATGQVLEVPVGEALLGRVLDPLGKPLDGGSAIAPERFDPADRPAPEIIERELVTEPLATGILVIDALFPLGRGQRELIVGDRATGKTAIAVDTIINQRRSDVICVYVAIGQKSSSVKQVIEAVRRHGAFERCIFVVAEPEFPAGLQWLAPYAGFTMGEYFRARGRHVLVVVDDLTKHAATHRELALLLRQPPGREAYPGDIFHVHARLLERAANLSAERGGGSLTALPIAETQAGNLSAYIPTNLISITDGQFYLDAKLFHEGQKPAVDVGRSVSRVGGKAQPPALRELSGSLRLELHPVSRARDLHPLRRHGRRPDPQDHRTWPPDPCCAIAGTVSAPAAGAADRPPASLCPKGSSTSWPPSNSPRSGRACRIGSRSTPPPQCTGSSNRVSWTGRRRARCSARCGI